MRNTLLIFITCLAFNLSQAATFCPKTSAEFLNALTTASNNGQHDVIKLSQLTYSTNSAFDMTTFEDFDLVISGGWSDFNQLVCVSQLGDPEATILSGNDTTTVLSISNEGQNAIEISNLTIKFGNTLSTFVAGGIHLYNGVNQLGETLIDRVYFKYNTSDAASALRIIGGDSVTVRNSVFYNNWSREGNGAIDVFLRPGARGLYFTNNTVLFNYSHTLNQTETVNGLATDGLLVELSSNDNGNEALIANNIFWANGNLDWNVSQPGIYYVYNNRYLSSAGIADFSVNNFSDLPMMPEALADPDNDFTPDIASPVVDAGFTGSNATAFLSAWKPGIEDFDRGIGGRVINGRIDVGAVEAPAEVPIFQDGFD